MFAGVDCWYAVRYDLSRLLCVWLSIIICFVFLMIRRPPRSTLDRSSAASDVYKRQVQGIQVGVIASDVDNSVGSYGGGGLEGSGGAGDLFLLHISEPTRPY